MPGKTIRIRRRVARGAGATHSHLSAIEPKLDRTRFRRHITDTQCIGRIDRNIDIVLDLPRQAFPGDDHQIWMHVTVVGIDVRIRHDPPVSAIEGPGGNLQPRWPAGRAFAAGKCNTSQCGYHTRQGSATTQFCSHRKHSANPHSLIGVRGICCDSIRCLRVEQAEWDPGGWIIGSSGDYTWGIAQRRCGWAPHISVEVADPPQRDSLLLTVCVTENPPGVFTGS